MDCLNLSAVVAHDIDRVRMQGLDLKPFGGLARILDPHGHVHEQLRADAPFIDPAFGQQCCRCEAMVQIDTEAEGVLARHVHHLLGRADLIADRLLAQHSQTGFKRLYRRFVMLLVQ